MKRKKSPVSPSRSRSALKRGYRAAPFGVQALACPPATQRLQNKVAIVTGAGRGIGVALATGLAREGAAVIVNYSRSAAQAQNVVREICGANGKALAVEADVQDLTHHERLLNAALKNFG